MISIIICSKKKEISPTLQNNIKATIGVDVELIVIDNSDNNRSIFSAYNQGFNQSSSDFLCFVHEDVVFCSENWGEKLISHLQNKEVGIIGVAGGKIMTKTPASWSVGQQYKNIIQHKKNKFSKSLEREPRNFKELRTSAIVLDGVFLAMRRDLFNKIRFDENFHGFHGYDYDISVQSIVAGYTNYVVYDILLEHYSKGNKNREYYLNLIKVQQKWKDHLPLICKDIAEETKSKIQEIEVKRLEKLMHRMAKTEFTSEEIIYNTKLFVDIIDTEAAKKLLNFIHFKIFFQRLLKFQIHLFK